MRRTAVALIHHPVLGRGGEVLTTTLTNLDMHDMARSVRTYGLAGFYVVHPYPSQRLLAERIRRHWVEGAGGQRIPDRAVALECLHIVPDMNAACQGLALGERVELWTTAASPRGEVSSYAEARERLAGAGPPVMLCFGTGWGLAPGLLDEAALRLEPIRAAADSGYNHLSVRAACAITLDRLFG